MKILVIHNHYLEKGGEDEAVNAEVSLLQEYGHKVILYEKTNEYIKKLTFFRKLIFGLKELTFSKTVYKEIRGIIKKENPDIAHVHNIFLCITPAVYLALKNENLPIVQTLHNYRFFCIGGIFFCNGKICEKCKNKKFFNAVIRRCWRGSFILSYILAKLLYRSDYFLKSIDSYIALSKFSRDKFIEFGLEKRKIYLKTNFLEIKSDGKNQDYNYALFIGRLVDYKGIRTLIKAFKMSPAFKLKIIGDGPLKNEVLDIASSCDNIKWLGRLDKGSVLEEIKKSSFLIFPSQCYETMGMVIMESFIYAKPVLASNLGAAKELIIDGVNGILFEPGDASDLATKVSYLFTHNKERLEMGKDAYKTYQERFNKEKSYKELMGIYTETINSRKRTKLN